MELSGYSLILLMVHSNRLCTMLQSYSPVGGLLSITMEELYNLSATNASVMMDVPSEDGYVLVTQIRKYVPILWYTVGYPGNILAFIFWIRRCMRSSSGCYLSALAASDFMFLVCRVMYCITYEIKCMQRNCEI